jgi:hypothetical protein
MEDSRKEHGIYCESCGEYAEKYFNCYPICNNVVCYQVRLDYIKNKIEELNKKVDNNA